MSARRFRRRDSARHAIGRHGFDMAVKEALTVVQDTPAPAPRTEPLAATQARTEQFPAARQLASEHRRWYGWGTTALDLPPARTRRYVATPEREADPLTRPGRLSPATAPVAADLDMRVFRETAYSQLAADTPPAALLAGGSWRTRLARAYRNRTRNVTMPGYGTEPPPSLPAWRVAEKMAARITGGAL